jgi:cysteine-rich repeat protein
MRARRLLLLCVAALCFASVIPSAPAHAKPCKNGRFLVKQTGTRYFDAVTLAGGQVSIDKMCSPARGKFRGGRKTSVAARWRACEAYRNAHLSAKIRDCRDMKGKLRARNPKLNMNFNARRSTCADGVVDVDGGEACEPPGTQACDARCRGIVGATAICGNGLVETGEQCDDGNPSAGDGCDACAFERCGDGVVDPGEPCDDGNQDDSDDCTRACQLTACQGPFDSTWLAIQKVIFGQHGCTDALCHGASAQGGLSLVSHNVHHALIDAYSPLGQMDLVEPGDQEKSFLWRKLAAATIGLPGVPGTPMPSGPPPISKDELDALRLWIRAGAPETGVVPHTQTLLRSCLPSAGPITIRAPAPPAPDEGVQLHAPPRSLAAHSENEVCFATYYDFSATLPAAATGPCPPEWGGAQKQCFFYKRSNLTQDPNSHHSILHIYRGAYDVLSASAGNVPYFGPFTCRGGPKDGQPCQPKGIGVAAPAGADCGAGGGCAGRIVPAVNCINYGPPDYGLDAGGGTANSPQVDGSQEPYSERNFPAGAYSAAPAAGIVVWNSHAFNTTDQSTTNEQWWNLYFASPQERIHPVRAIFDSSRIFVQNVPAFEQIEYCNTFTLPKGSRLFQLSTHFHKRGKLFRVWAPGSAPCPPNASTPPGCAPEAGAPLVTTTDYSDPAELWLTDPLVLDQQDAASRTIKYCALYDNGFTNRADVKRRSTSPPSGLAFFGIGGPCPVAETRCIGGPKHNELCNGSHAFCNDLPGDGVCDACPLKGGVTTEDEMFILLGGYYIVP